MTKITVTRHQDIDCGHRVVGHEGQCARLHGHTYRIHFTCMGEHLDSIGRVIDFGVIKARLCQWLLDNWDHRFLMWEKDPWLSITAEITIGQSKVLPGARECTYIGAEEFGIVETPFNPTSENIAQYLLQVVGPIVLADTGVTLVQVRVEETRKCSAVAEL